MSDSVTPWTVARRAPLPVGFSRQEHWSGLPFLLQGVLHPGVGHGSCVGRRILHCGAAREALKQGSLLAEVTKEWPTWDRTLDLVSSLRSHHDDRYTASAVPASQAACPLD